MLPEGVDGAPLGFAQERLELGKDLLDGVEVGGIRRQIDDSGSDSFDGLLNSADLVTAQVVGHNDVAWLEGRAEEVLDISQEDFPVDGAIDDQWRSQALLTQAGDESGRLPVPVRDCRYTALSSGRASVTAGHVGTGPGFIQKNQLGAVQHWLASPPFTTRLLHVGALLLAGVQGFF